MIHLWGRSRGQHDGHLGVLIGHSFGRTYRRGVSSEGSHERFDPRNQISDADEDGLSLGWGCTRKELQEQGRTG